MKETQSTIIDLKNLDLNAFNTLAISWQVDFLQLEKGKFSSTLRQVLYEEYQLGYVTFNCGVKQEGTSPSGMWTFAFLKDTKIHWRNYKVKPYSIIVYAPGSEINAVNFDALELVTFSVSDHALKRIVSENNMNSQYELLLNLELLELEEALFLALFDRLKKEIHSDTATTNFKVNTSIQLLKLIEKPLKAPTIISRINRLALLQKAELYINQNIEEAFTVVDLAKHLEISERTLLYCFKRRYGIGPKAFVNILKLNKVYHSLCDIEDPEASISNLARVHGFWHIGQFHKDYTAFYGERASDTLIRHAVGR